MKKSENPQSGSETKHLTTPPPRQDRSLSGNRSVSDAPHARQRTSMKRVVSVELLKKGFPAFLPPRGKYALASLSEKPEHTSGCQSGKEWRSRENKTKSHCFNKYESYSIRSGRADKTTPEYCHPTAAQLANQQRKEMPGSHARPQPFLDIAHPASTFDRLAMASSSPFVVVASGLRANPDLLVTAFCRGPKFLSL